MPITTPTAGQTEWDVPLNAVLNELDNRLQEISYNVTEYGAVGNGTTDDTTAIQAAIDASPSGGIVYMPPGTYAVTAPLRLHPSLTLLGTSGAWISNTGVTIPQSFLTPTAAFAGNSVIEMVDQTTGSYSDESSGQRIISVTVDGGAAPTGSSIDGIRASGFVHGVTLQDVTLRDMTGRGVYTVSSGGENPYSWRMKKILADGCGGIGYSLNGLTDSTLIDVESIASGSHGFFMTGMANSHLTNCRAEHSGLHGYYLSGSWGTGTGSGSATMTGCSTDRNERNGILIDATGNAPLIMSNLLLRRDGRNAGSGGGSYAGLNVNAATMPVILNQVSCYPGVDDDGSGTNSPQYGVSTTGATYISLAGGFLHANTAGFNDGGGNAVLRRGPNIPTRTGSTSAPTDAFAQPWTAHGTGTVVEGSLSVATPGRSLRVAEGSNATMGTATLVAGAATVNTTAVTANSRIQLTSQADGGTPGFLRVSARTASTSFTITSSSGTDTSTVAWIMFEPA